MRPELPLLLLIGIALAAPITVSIDNPGNYAIIDYSFPFENPLPGYSYRGNITATWNIPDSSLAGIDATEVPLYITISAPQDGSVKFSGSLLPQHKSQIKLICYVVNGACAGDSILQGTLSVQFNPSSLGEEGEISMNVSTTPGPGLAEEFVGAASGAISSGLSAAEGNASNGTTLSSLIAPTATAQKGKAIEEAPLGVPALIGMVLVIILAVAAGRFYLRNRR